MDQQKGKKILMTRDAVAVFRDISEASSSIIDPHV